MNDILYPKVSFEQALKCAFEEASRRDIDCGKAVQSNVCPKYGSQMSASRKNTGYTWTCLNLDCLNHVFEADQK